MWNLQLLWASALVGVLLSCDGIVVQQPPKFEKILITHYEIVPDDSSKNSVTDVKHNDNVLNNAWFGSGWNVNENVHWTQTDGDHMTVFLECTAFSVYFESHEWTGDVEISYSGIVDTFSTYSNRPVESLDTVVYRSPDLKYDFHKVRIASLNEAIGIKRLELYYSYPFYRKIITQREFRDTCSNNSIQASQSIPLVFKE